MWNDANTHSGCGAADGHSCSDCDCHSNVHANVHRYHVSGVYRDTPRHLDAGRDNGAFG